MLDLPDVGTRPWHQDGLTPPCLVASSAYAWWGACLEQRGGWNWAGGGLKWGRDQQWPLCPQPNTGSLVCTGRISNAELRRPIAGAVLLPRGEGDKCSSFGTTALTGAGLLRIGLKAATHMHLCCLPGVFHVSFN